MFRGWSLHKLVGGLIVLVGPAVVTLRAGIYIRHRQIFDGSREHRRQWLTGSQLNEPSPQTVHV